jgi:cellulose synthase/poly-beta-1,6-N-acetylglucosamine synthase-like glycosyltransferase
VAAADAPSCTVVVCTRDRPQLLDRCLGALARVHYPRLDVVVVDNGAPESGAQAVARRRNARYLVEPRRGLSRARNLGAGACQSELIAYLDDDSLPEPAWLGALATEFADQSVMAVAGRIGPTRLEQPSELLFELAGGFTPNGSIRRTVDDRTDGWFGLANFGGIGTGGNMAFRRRAFELWPGFDERLGAGARLPGAEEHHAFFSLIARGYRVVYTPKAVVRHPYPSTMEELHRRHVCTVAHSTTYLLHLLAETPGHRWAALSFAARSLFAGSLPDDPDVRRGRRRIGPWYDLPRAIMIGACDYVHFRLAGLEDGLPARRGIPSRSPA